MPETMFTRRRLLVAAVALVGAVTLFSSGALVARATMSDDSTPSPATPSPASVNGAKTLIEPAPAQSIDSFGGGADGRGGAPSTGLASSGYYGGCLAPLPAEVLSDGALDLAKAGFTTRMLGAGFALESAALTNQGECTGSGARPTTGDLTFQTSWLHAASGIDLNVSQRQATDPVANVIARGSATFWSGGYAFTVSANGGLGPVAVDLPVAPGGPIASDGAKLIEVLGLAVGQLAPNLGLQCFYRESESSWDGLATIGIGDPRNAIPSGFVEQNVSVRTFTPPAAGCDTPAPDDQGGFDAGFAKAGANGEFGGFIGMSATALQKGQEPYPGQLTEYGANWTTSRFQFSVYAKTLEPLSVDTIRAIAKALDPTFNETCLIQQRDLTDVEVAAAGFRSPALTNGFKITNSSRTVTELGSPGANCPNPTGFEKHYNLSWTLEGGADSINVNVNRAGIADKGQGFISNSQIIWVGTDGTMYSVSGASRGISPNVSKDVLVAVAKSLDPGLDIAKLPTAPDGVSGSTPPVPPDAPRK